MFYLRAHMWYTCSQCIYDTSVLKASSLCLKLHVSYITVFKQCKFIDNFNIMDERRKIILNNILGISIGKSSKKKNV